MIHDCYLISCDAFFGDTVLVIMENKVVIMLLEIRVLFCFFSRYKFLIKMNKIF